MCSLKKTVLVKIIFFQNNGKLFNDFFFLLSFLIDVAFSNNEILKVLNLNYNNQTLIKKNT